MMNKMKKILSIILCFAMMFSCVQTVCAEEAKEAEQYDIYPIVRDIEYDGTEFTLDSDVNVVYGSGIDDATKAYLEEVLTENGMTAKVVEKAESGKSNIILNVNGMEGGDFAEKLPEVTIRDIFVDMKDLADDYWSLDALQYAYDNSFITGKKDDDGNPIMDPTGVANRAQIVTILYRMEGSPEVTDFSAYTYFDDVSETDYFGEAVCWAYNNKIAEGTNGSFNPYKPVLRQQMAKFLYTYAEYKGLDVSVRAELTNMADADSMDDYACDYVKWAVGTELIKGSPISNSDKFMLKPKGQTTREQFATILQRFCATLENDNEAATVSEDAEFFENYDAYTLETREKQIKITGKDSDAVFHGVSTLNMMLSSFENNRLLGVKIEDYAGMEYRGFIEGFYGSWSHENRKSLMEFAKDIKMNMYIYAAKGDSYHTNNWAVKYPEAQVNEFKELVKLGEETKCEFVWSVHLGSFFSAIANKNYDETFYNAQYDLLMAKFKQLYDIGVRKFDVLNDDFGAGTHTFVVTVLNRLNKDLTDMGCVPITYCPQGYNKAWSGNGAELAALKELDDSIVIYWTGDDVNWPITQSTVDFLTEKTNHEPCFWLNYPVNEHAGSGIFLGDITYYARDGVKGLRGAVSNPSRYAQSTKVALFQLSALFWNNTNYSTHAEDIWLDSFNYLEKEVIEEYRTIAKNTSNCPNSGRISAGFPESEYIKAELEAVLAKAVEGESVKDMDEVKVLQDEFEKILNAIEVFRKECTNKNLVTELTPWLNSLEDVTNAANDILASVIALEEGDLATAWSAFATASKALEGWDDYKNDADKSALAGSKRLQPFANDLVDYVEGTLTPIFDTNYSAQKLIAVLGGQKKSMDDNAAKMFDGDLLTSTQWNVVQQKDDYFGVDLGVVKKVTDIRIIQGNTDSDHDIFHKAVLEYSKDGKTYTQIGEQYNDAYMIELDDLDIEARYVRLRLAATGTASKPDFWTHIREFTVNEEKPDGNRVYTNVEAYAKQPLTIAGKEYSLADMKNVTLESGEYLGIKFTDLVNVSNVSFEGTGLDGLSVFASENGVFVWNALASSESQILKYIWVENTTGDAITFNLDKLGVMVDSAKANPKFLETNLTNGIKEGSWDNVFDGKDGTHVWTNEGQTTGDYITFDFGASIDLYDLEIVTADGNPRLYNAEIQISTDKTNWKTIAKVENDNSVFEVPYRYVRANAGGETARYLRIYFTGSTGYYFKLQEIFFNETVEVVDETAEITASFGTDIEKAIDGNLSTIFSGKADVEDYIEYKFTEAANFHAISILQDPSKVSNAKVSLLKEGGYEEIGKLDESAKKFELDSTEYVCGLKITFEGETDISLYEIYLEADKSANSDIGEYVEPIIIQKTEDVTTPANIALGKTTAVSGTSDGNKANVNDGDINTKWDSDAIKGDGAKENSWLYIDLGADKTNIFNAMKISYHNKVYPTAMEIQVSNDAKNWVTVKSLTSEHNGPTFPVVSENFETAYAARYVRLFFEELNNVAAGNGVGVKEWEITGITLSDMKFKSAEAVADINVAVNTAADDLELPQFVKVVLTKDAAEDKEVLVPVTWNLASYDGSAAGTSVVEGTLNLPESVTAENAKVTVNVIAK